MTTDRSQFKTLEAAFHEEARAVLLQGVESLPLANQRVFRLMYARDGGKRSVADAEIMPLRDVVAEIQANRLDWAMQQVQAAQQKLAERTAAAIGEQA